MLRHVVMFRLLEEVPRGTLQSLREGLSLLAKSIPEIINYSFGEDLGLASGNFDFAIVAEFKDPDAFQRYLDHPDHLAFVADRLKPVLAERAATQFSF